MQCLCPGKEMALKMTSRDVGLTFVVGMRFVLSHNRNLNGSNMIKWQKLAVILAVRYPLETGEVLRCKPPFPVVYTSTSRL